MPDSTSAQPILDAAEQAATAGDIDAAEQLLRQAARLQETHLGPHHPDLANTLNNLGVVCEKTGRLDEAASCYRRAYDIAAAAFDPDHPFVITSRKNLADFREAHGESFEPPATTAAAPSASPPQPVAPSTIEPSISADARPAAKPRGFQITRSSAVTIALVAVVVLVVLGAIVMRRPSTPDESRSPDLPPAVQAPIESVTPPNASANSGAPVAAQPAVPSKGAAPPPAVRDKRSVPEARAGSARGSAQPAVALAKVCRRFSTAGSPDWRCEQIGSSVAPGSLVYYTRIKAASATAVEHRWYHGDDLQQRVRLNVAANSDPGYRTYSRLAVSATGRWRVEARTTNGTLLHEARFNVR
jgi:hypothetical protein